MNRYYHIVKSQNKYQFFDTANENEIALVWFHNNHWRISSMSSSQICHSDFHYYSSEGEAIESIIKSFNLLGWKELSRKQYEKCVSIL